MTHKIDENKVKKEAKQILDKFAHALEKVKHEHDLDFYVNREDFERIKAGSANKFSEDSKIDNNFKKKILENAPNKDEDFIIAEKGSWK